MYPPNAITKVAVVIVVEKPLPPHMLPGRKRKPKPEEGDAGTDSNSLEVIANAKVEPSLAIAVVGARYQFERLGYFCVDLDSKPGKLVFNRTVALKDTWAKVEKKQGAKS